MAFSPQELKKLSKSDQEAWAKANSDLQRALDLTDGGKVTELDKNTDVLRAQEKVLRAQQAAKEKEVKSANQDYLLVKTPARKAYLDARIAELNAINSSILIVLRDIDSSITARKDFVNKSVTFIDDNGEVQEIRDLDVPILTKRVEDLEVKLRVKLQTISVESGQGYISQEATTGAEVTVEANEYKFLDYSFASGVRHSKGQIIPWDEKLGVNTNPKIRIFVMGVEVTDYVSTVTWSDDAGSEVLTNTASVTLLVPHDLFTLTTKNLTVVDSKNNPITTRDSEGNDVPGRWILPINQDFRTSEHCKKLLYDYKKSQNFFEKSTLLPRWNLTHNTLILHSNDTCRIFVQIPWTKTDAWYPKFTGYLDTVTIVRNMTGEDVITFGLKTLADKLAKSRVATSRISPSLLDLTDKNNPSVRKPTESVPIGNSNIDFVDSNTIYTDIVNPSFAGSPLFNMTLPRLIKFLFYGDTSIDAADTKALQDKGEDPAVLKEAKELAAAIQRQQELVRSIENKLKTLPMGKSERTKVIESLKAEKIKLNQLQDKGRKPSYKGQPLLNPDGTWNSLLDKNPVWVDLKYKRGWGNLDLRLFVSETFPGPYLPTTPANQSATETKTQTNRNELTQANVLRHSGVPSTLQKGWPVASKKVTSSYGMRTHPVTGKVTMHFGIDVSTNGKSMDLLAPIDGFVYQYDRTEIAGQFMRFVGLDGIVHEFMHLAFDAITAIAKASLCSHSIIKLGEKLGLTGKTGRGTGYHLHWGVWRPKTIIAIDTPFKSELVAQPNRDYSIFPQGAVSWLDRVEFDEAKKKASIPTTPAPTATVSNVLNIQPNYDESNIDWKVEEGYFALWHIRCLVGFANGVPESYLASEQYTSESVQAKKVNSEENAKKYNEYKQRLSVIDREIKKIEAEITRLTKSSSTLVQGKIQTLSKNLATLKGEKATLETQLTILSPYTNKLKIQTSLNIQASSLTTIDTAEIDALELRKAAEYRIGIIKDSIFAPDVVNETPNPNSVTWLTNDEVNFIGRNSGWLGMYSPHGKAVTVALRKPLAGWGYASSLQEFTLSDCKWDVGFQSRLELLSDMLQKLDYYWTITGNGDVVVTFPHYELITAHYGPDWGPALRFKGITSQDSLQENFGELKAAYTFRGGFFGGNGKIENSKTAQDISWTVLTTVYKFPNVLVREGLEIEHVHWPWINDKARLEILAGIYLRKKIANCYKYTMAELPPLVYLIPNTPVYFADIDAYALVKGTNTTWSLSGNSISYKMTLNLTAVKLRLSDDQIFLRSTDQNSIVEDNQTQKAELASKTT